MELQLALYVTGFTTECISEVMFSTPSQGDWMIWTIPIYQVPPEICEWQRQMLWWPDRRGDIDAIGLNLPIKQDQDSDGLVIRIIIQIPVNMLWLVANNQDCDHFKWFCLIPEHLKLWWHGDNDCEGLWMIKTGPWRWKLYLDEMRAFGDLQTISLVKPRLVHKRQIVRYGMNEKPWNTCIAWTIDAQLTIFLFSGPWILTY